MRVWRDARLAVLASLPIRLALAAGTELSPDEAYYLCAARLGGRGLRLVDHPPMVVWLAGLGDHLPALPLELRVRLPFVLLSIALTLACVAVTDQRGAGPRGRSLVAFVMSFGLLPMAGGFVATPDVPAMLAIVAALAWAGPTRPRTGSWHAFAALGTGAVLAAGALSKVVVLPVAIAVAVGARGRAWPARVALLAPVAALFALLVPSLGFQARHAFGTKGLDLLGGLGALGAAAGAQVVLWSPWLLSRGLAELRRTPSSPETVVAATLTALVALSAVLRAIPPEPNWWAPAALAIAIAAGGQPRAPAKQAAKRAAELADRARPAILAWLLVPTLLATAHALVPFLPLAVQKDPTARLHGWKTDHPPLDAPGVGAYAEAAERCIQRAECDNIRSYFNALNGWH